MKFSPQRTARWMAARIFGTMLFLMALSVASAQTATNIQVTSTVQQSSVKRLGVNLGDETYWDSGQLLKNLVFENPGFEGMKYRSIMICAAVTSSTCTDDNNYSPQPTGFWTGGTYTILSGKSAGTSGTIVSSTQNPSSCSGCGQIIQFDKNLNTAVGDYYVLTNNFPGSGDAGWWDNTSGGGTITTETNDLSPETPGKQAIVLNAAAAGKSALLTSYFDNENGLSFIQLNGAFAVTFRAKGVGGNNQVNVSVQRLESTGFVTYLNQTLTLTNAWQDYTLPFSANETGNATGTVQLVFGVGGSTVELDDVSLAQTNSSASNPTAFRDDVVNALKELNPGTIRMMAAGAALGSDIPNQLQVPFARYREGFSTGATTENAVAYGIHEFLQLCQTVGADPWITIPTATTTTEMTDFIEYLTGTGSDPWSSLRISRGQSAPWTSVFNKIHIEFGNETWNGSFRGESMDYNAYPGLANQIFGAARQTPGYVASKFDLVLDGFAAGAGYNQILLAGSNQHDSLDIAPYLLYSANNEAQATMFGALLAEPELFEGTTGEVYADIGAVQTAPTSTYMNVYETNLGTMVGNITQTQLDSLTPSIGAGIAHADHQLQMMRLGVQYQNTFSLPQYNYKRSDGLIAKLWGVVVDMGKTNRRRPQFLTQAMANAVIGGNMLQTVQTGANPIWNQPLSSDGVILPTAHMLQSFAFQNGSALSTIVFNLNQTAAVPVTFSGPNAPTGTVQMTQITSANITDNNETADVVAPTTQALNGVNSSTVISLPPFSMTVLTTASNAVAAPAFSVASGTYTTAQSVSISDATSGAAIYYTTDGSTPTTSSTLYNGPVTVSSSETLQAIATLSGLSPSAMTTATYVIGSAATAATPAFSVAGGTYSSAQTVNITDATSGATIYYTTNGTTPTTGSTKYTGSITVSSSETLKAIAIATNFSNSAVASATYTIGAATAATPAFSVAGGTYSSAQTVTITDATSGAAIYYTTNGAAPTTGSTKYAGPITVSSSETIEAIAVAANFTKSAVASVSYTISTTAATPAFSVAGGTYSSAQSVTITDATAGAAVYYTTNGATPTTGSAKYTGAITVSTSETLKAIAVATNFTNSAVASASYTISTAAATPTFSLAAGTYSSAQQLSMKDTTSNSAIHYTTNGTTATSASPMYTGPVTISTSETVSAIAVAYGFANSAPATAAYVIGAKVAAPPAFSVAAGTYSSAQSVSITDSTSGAAIYYTTNGSTPTTGSTKYAGAITVSSTETLKAIAVATNFTNSAVTTAAYTIATTTAARPTYSLAPGIYSTTQHLSMSDSTAGTTIYYTTNGSTPTTASAKYAGTLTISSTETINAIAVAPGAATSPMATGTYTIAAAAARPTYSLAPGTYSTTQHLSMSDSTAGTTIYYTTNGSTPTTASAKYAGTLTISSTETINAIAVAPGAATSPMATGLYTIASAPADGQATAMPTFSVAPGAYSTAQNVSLASTTSGATIYYTTNGSTPTTSSTKYSGAVQVAATETLSAIAIAANHTASPVAKAAYVISVPAMPGFTTSELQLHGSAAIVGTTLRLTNGAPAQSAVAWSNAPVPVSAFTADFTFQLPTSTADGFTFTIHNSPTGTWATGSNAGGLGYSGIANSVAIKFALYSDVTNGMVSQTGLLENGQSPSSAQSIDMSSNLSLHAGHLYSVHLVYAGTTLAETVTDTNTGGVFTHSYAVNIPSIVGGSNAYVGFTGSTGGFTSVQNLLTWGWASQSATTQVAAK
jgi:alpha-L-arabinofuranosidase